MSGSGGSGDVGGGFGGPETPECATLRVIVTLSNPQPDVRAELEVGHELAVERREQAGYSQVVVLSADGRLAGVVIGNALAQLLECLEAGFSYVAEVRSIEGGAVELVVSPRG